MFRPSASNQRAVLFPIVLIATAMCLALSAGAEVFLTGSEYDEAGSSGQRFGASVDGIMDINGDGAWELIVGAPGDPTNGIEAGAVYFWYGGAALTVAPDRLWLNPSASAAYDQFGWSVARIGDVNGGGKDDWAIGAPAGTTHDSEFGKVYVFFGEKSLTQSPLVIAGEGANDRFGFCLDAAGDFDGDGTDDFIVGAPFNNAPGVDQGAAYVIFGSSSEPSSDLGDALKLTAGLAGDHFGWSVAGAGNFLAGADCVAVGAPQNDGRGIESGAVYVFEGGTNPNAISDETLDAGETLAYAWYGYSLDSAGRFDNDTYDDLVIGAPNNGVTVRAGRVDVVYGGTSVSTTGDVTVDGQVASDLFGFSVAGVHDVEGTSRDDVLIGAPGVSLDGAGAGRAYLYRGGSGSLASSATLALPLSVMIPARADQAGDEWGYAVGSAGDFDGDSAWDYAVGATSANNFAGTEAGVCRLSDDAGTVVRNDLQLWNADWDQGEVQLRFELALDRNSIVRLRLDRRDLDEQGFELARHTLYDGPATPLGSLAVTAAGFAFRDELARGNASELSYELRIETTTGSELNFTALAGPGPIEPVAGLELAGARPNPFNPTTWIRFRAPRGEAVQCRVLDLRGRTVAELVQGAATGQWQSVRWDGQSTDGGPVASGLYLVQVRQGAEVRTQRVVLAK